MPKEKEIRAYYTDSFIRVYQAYNDSIADSALHNKRFVSPPFKLERTTWIKPSFLWMMYRSSWATKENQQRILAIDISHQGFLWALTHSSLSHFDNTLYRNLEEWEKTKRASPVIIQWDPERDILLNKLNYRTIQIGLTLHAAKLYAEQWIIDISDITSIAPKIKSAIKDNKLLQASSLLPAERIYPLSDPVKQKIGINI